MRLSMLIVPSSQCCDKFLYLSSLEDILDRLRDLRTNTITLNQSNSVLALLCK